MFCIVLIASLLPSTDEKSLAPSPLFLPISYLWIRCPLNLLYAQQSQLSISSFMTDGPVSSPSSWPYTGLSPVSPHLLYCGTQNQKQHSSASPVTTTFLNLLVILTTMQPPHAVGLFCHKGSLTVNFMIPRTPRSFSAKFFSTWTAPSIYWCLHLFLLRNIGISLC